jgi:hypothetical protein
MGRDAAMVHSKRKSKVWAEVLPIWVCLAVASLKGLEAGRSNPSSLILGSFVEVSCRKGLILQLGIHHGPSPMEIQA